MRQIKNEFMAHAVANEWRSQKEVILLSQVVSITLLHLEGKKCILFKDCKEKRTEDDILLLF